MTVMPPHATAPEGAPSTPSGPECLRLLGSRLNGYEARPRPSSPHSSPLRSTLRTPRARPRPPPPWRSSSTTAVARRVWPLDVRVVTVVEQVTRRVPGARRALERAVRVDVDRARRRGHLVDRVVDQPGELVAAEDEVLAESTADRAVDRDVPVAEQGDPQVGTVVDAVDRRDDPGQAVAQAGDRGGPAARPRGREAALVVDPVEIEVVGPHLDEDEVGAREVATGRTRSRGRPRRPTWSSRRSRRCAPPSPGGSARRAADRPARRSRCSRTSRPTARSRRDPRASAVRAADGSRRAAGRRSRALRAHRSWRPLSGPGRDRP